MFVDSKSDTQSAKICKTEDVSEVYKRRNKKEGISASDYFTTKTPVDESKGELIDEFITPDVNSELDASQQNVSNLYLNRYIEPPQELDEQNETIKTGIGWDEVEPELPSESRFVPIN